MVFWVHYVIYDTLMPYIDYAELHFISNKLYYNSLNTKIKGNYNPQYGKYIMILVLALEI